MAFTVRRRLQEAEICSLAGISRCLQFCSKQEKDTADEYTILSVAFIVCGLYWWRAFNLRQH